MKNLWLAMILILPHSGLANDLTCEVSSGNRSLRVFSIEKRDSRLDQVGEGLMGIDNNSYSTWLGGLLTMNLQTSPDPGEIYVNLRYRNRKGVPMASHRELISTTQNFNTVLATDNFRLNVYCVPTSKAWENLLRRAQQPLSIRKFGPETICQGPVDWDGHNYVIHDEVWYRAPSMEVCQYLGSLPSDQMITVDPGRYPQGGDILWGN